MSLTPHELELNQVTIGKLYPDLVLKSQTSMLVVEPLLYKKRRFKLVLRGDVITNGINAGPYGHSLGLRLSDPLDVEALKYFEQFPKIWFPNIYQGGETVRPVVKTDIIFLKLRQKDDKYRFTSDIPIDPSTPGTNPPRGTAAEIVVEFAVYWNAEQKVWGFIVDPVTIKTKFKKRVKQNSTLE